MAAAVYCTIIDGVIFMQQRLNGRSNNELRAVSIVRGYTKYAEGSVLVSFGDTKVICTATVIEGVPSFLKEQDGGWITAEYSMLPRATATRNSREMVGSSVNSRSREISRLIGRSLRSSVDLLLLGKRQILIDCDVIQADGGTRTASITGAFVALHDAIDKLVKSKVIAINPIKSFLAAISVGVVASVPLLDLDYDEDKDCDSDINVVMFEDGKIVEIQGTAENAAFSRGELDKLLDLAGSGIAELINIQKRALGIL